MSKCEEVGRGRGGGGRGRMMRNYADNTKFVAAKRVKSKIAAFMRTTLPNVTVQIRETLTRSLE